MKALPQYFLYLKFERVETDLGGGGGGGGGGGVLMSQSQIDR